MDLERQLELMSMCDLNHSLSMKDTILKNKGSCFDVQFVGQMREELNDWLQDTIKSHDRMPKVLLDFLGFEEQFIMFYEMIINRSTIPESRPHSSWRF